MCTNLLWTLKGPIPTSVCSVHTDRQRWHEAHDCISVTVDLTQPLDSERHSQQHSRMCIQIFSQLVSYTHSLLILTHTHTHTQANWSVPHFQTLLYVELNIFKFRVLEVSLKKNKNKNERSNMYQKKELILCYKPSVENSSNAFYTVWTFLYSSFE